MGTHSNVFACLKSNIYFPINTSLDSGLSPETENTLQEPMIKEAIANNNEVKEMEKTDYQIITEQCFVFVDSLNRIYTHLNTLTSKLDSLTSFVQDNVRMQPFIKGSSRQRNFKETLNRNSEVKRILQLNHTALTILPYRGRIPYWGT